MVEGIEHLEAELHFRSLSELDMLAERRVVVLLSWSLKMFLGVLPKVSARFAGRR